MADRLPSGRGGTAAAALVAALVADLLSRGTALSRAGSGALAATTAAAPRTCRWVDTALENGCVPQSADLSASETARRAFTGLLPSGLMAPMGPTIAAAFAAACFASSLAFSSAYSFLQQTASIASGAEHRGQGWRHVHRQLLLAPAQPDRCSRWPAVGRGARHTGSNCRASALQTLTGASLQPEKGWWHAPTQRLQPLGSLTDVASSCWRIALPILPVAGVVPAGLPCGEVKVVHITLWTSAAEKAAKCVRQRKAEMLVHESSVGNSET